MEMSLLIFEKQHLHSPAPAPGAGVRQAICQANRVSPYKGGDCFATLATLAPARFAKQIEVRV